MTGECEVCVRKLLDVYDALCSMLRMSEDIPTVKTHYEYARKHTSEIEELRCISEEGIAKLRENLEKIKKGIEEKNSEIISAGASEAALTIYKYSPNVCSK